MSFVQQRKRADLVRPLALLALACAHGRGLESMPAVVESAYLQARAGGCPAGDAGCCRERASAAGSAAACGDTLGAARLWQEVARACPEQRRQATLAALTPAPAQAAGQASRAFNVSYRVRLPPAYRLYWVATALGQRLLPMLAPPSSAIGTLAVQVHAIRFDQSGRPGPLLALERRFDVEVPFSREATVIVEIAEPPTGADAPLAIGARVDPVIVARNPPPARPPPPPRPVRVERARPLHLPPARLPAEFTFLAGLPRPALRVCLDREGEVDTVRLLEPVHPRFAASLIDMLRDSRHEPYRVNDLAVPSCDLLVPAFAPPEAAR